MEFSNVVRNIFWDIQWL